MQITIERKATGCPDTRHVVHQGCDAMSGCLGNNRREVREIRPDEPKIIRPQFLARYGARTGYLNGETTLNRYRPYTGRPLAEHGRRYAHRYREFGLYTMPCFEEF